MLILAVFLAGLLAYSLLSRLLETRGLTPQIWVLGLGLVVGITPAGRAGVTTDLEALRTLGEAALILCLFVDAARIDIRALRGTAQLPIRLLAIGLPLTIVAGTMAARIVLPGITLLEAILLAVLVAPTDAALGAAVVTSQRLPLRIRQALNVESGLNDGLVTPLVLVVAAAIIAGPAEGSSGWVAEAASAIGLGTIAGVVVGVAGALLLRSSIRRGWMLPGALWMTGPSLAFIAWLMASGLGGNAFIASFVAGLAVTATVGRVPTEVLGFGEVAGELLGMAVFFLFGVLATDLLPFDPGVVAFAVLALMIARPAPVAISLVRTGLAPQSVVFLGWFGPRGLATIVLGIIATDGGSTASAFAPEVFAAAVLTVMLSVIAHGLSARPAVAAYERFVKALPADAPEHDPTVELHGRSRYPQAPSGIVATVGTGTNGVPGSD